MRAPLRNHAEIEDQQDRTQNLLLHEEADSHPKWIWKRRVAAVSAALVAVVLVSVANFSRLRYKRPLVFRRSDSSDGASNSVSSAQEFKIVQLADLHFGENSWTEWGPEQDRKSIAAVKSILQHESDADLVILSGDQLTANNIVSNATTYLRMIIDAMIEAKPDVRWAQTWGNHDDAAYEDWWQDENGDWHTDYYDAKTTRVDLTHVDASYRGSLTQKGPATVFGTSNYYLNIYKPSSGLRTEPAARIYLLDSGGGSLDQELDQTQVNWLREEISKQPSIPGVAFQHIPTSYDAFSYNEDDGTCAGMNGEENVSPVKSDAGILDLISNAQSNIHFLSVGHNHGNDYCCQYNGISLCYGRHSGYGGYGKWDRGARVFVMGFDDDDDDRSSDVFSWHSYVRMESGEITDGYYPP